MHAVLHYDAGNAAFCFVVHRSGFIVVFPLFVVWREKRVCVNSEQSSKDSDAFFMLVVVLRSV